jgi:hypothetical protein
MSTAEEGEIHRLARELTIQHEDLVALRVAHRRHLPGMPRGEGTEDLQGRTLSAPTEICEIRVAAERGRKCAP